MITDEGDIPLSVLNVGIAAAMPGVVAQATVLLADLAAMAPAPLLQTAFAASPPLLPDLDSLVAAGDNLLAYASTLNPANWGPAAASVNVSVAADLGFAEAQLAIVGQALGAVEAGVATGGIATWCYAGPAPSYFDGLLDRAASEYYLREQVVDAFVVATDSDAAWATFAAGFNDAGLRDSPGPRIVYSGGASAGNLLTSLGRAYDVVRNLYLDLGARTTKLEADLQLTLGLDLPDPLDLMVPVDVDLGAITATVDFDSMFQAVGLQVDAVLDLVAELDLQLSGQALACWHFRGPAGSMGAEVSRAVGERFGGDVRVAVMTFAEPAAAASFATVFAVI